MYEKSVYEIFDHYKGERAPIEEVQSSYDPVVVTLEHLLSGSLPDALNRPHYKNESAHSEFNPRGACCQMLSDVLIGLGKPNFIECKGVCHTERACVDKFYPFKSEKQAMFFNNDIPRDGSHNSTLRDICSKMTHLLSPPYQWCHQWIVSPQEIKNTPEFSDRKLNASQLNQYNHRNINPLEATLPLTGCSSGAWDGVLLFPEAKLAFCGIPKVSITQWIQFLRFTTGAKDYQVSTRISVFCWIFKS